MQRLVRKKIIDYGKRSSARISTWLYRILGSRANGAFGILMYHRIAENTLGITRPTWNVTPENFYRQMERLLSCGYQVWPLRRIVEHCQAKKSIPEKITVITFDDCYENVYLHAWPVLKKLDIPATCFVATAYMDSTDPFPFDKWGLINQTSAPVESWRPMMWSQCREMEKSGLVEIGTHTHTHQDFRLREVEFKRDLETSLKILREKIGDKSYAFSFPFGSSKLGIVNDACIETAKELSLFCALTIEISLVQPATNPFIWGRLEVTDMDTSDSIVAKLEGWYNWMNFTRKVFRMISHPKFGIDKI